MTAPAHASLHGRVVVVTGASRGIGREFARTLAQAGARLTLVASHITDALRIADAEVRALAIPGGVLTLPSDVRDPAACDRVIRQTVDEFGAVDCVVNNAGVGMRLFSETFNTTPVNFWEGAAEDWQTVIDTNTLAPFFMARAAAPHMIARGFGRIVSVSTSPATMVRRGYSPYGPSKAALEAMTRIWAQDLAGTGVTANVILPGGATDTDFLPTRGERRGADGQLLPANIMNDALLWLLSDQANGINGRRIIGKLWDSSLPSAQAAEQAMTPPADSPAIM